MKPVVSTLLALAWLVFATGLIAEAPAPQPADTGGEAIALFTVR